jgi:hypothetical protein
MFVASVELTVIDSDRPSSMTGTACRVIADVKSMDLPRGIIYTFCIEVGCVLLFIIRALLNLSR